MLLEESPIPKTSKAQLTSCIMESIFNSCVSALVLISVRINVHHRRILFYFNFTKDLAIFLFGFDNVGKKMDLFKKLEIINETL